MPKDKTKDSEKAAKSQPYDPTQEALTLYATVRDGAAFLKPGISDISLVLLSAGLIEKVLRVSLISGLRADVVSKTMIADIFDGKGSLATFSAKIEVCAGLGNIVDNVRGDLKIINKIRNDFAHSPVELHLKDYPDCRTLRVTSTAPVQKDECIERQMFKRSCAGIIRRLAMAL